MPKIKINSLNFFQDALSTIKKCVLVEDEENELNGAKLEQFEQGSLALFSTSDSLDDGIIDSTSDTSQ